MKTKYDLIIAGGGPAGVCAAISAARHGVDVLLIEKYNALGGAAVFSLVMPFMNHFTKIDGEKKSLAGGLFMEIIKEMGKITGKEDLNLFDDEIYKLVLNRMALKAGVTLLFDTTVIGVNKSDDKITSVKVLGKSAVMELTADNYIDATGDAELSMFAGCDFKLGREEDSLCQPMTLCFRMSGVDKKKFEEIRPTITPLYKEFQKKGLIRNPREDVLIFGNFNDGVLHFNTTRIVKMNPTDPFDVTAAEIEAREQVFEMHKFLTENIPGFENARVLSTALQIGIRESRKVIGEYTLTVNDLKSLARFDDAVAVVNSDIDIHNPSGGGTSHYTFGDGEWYQIPYRCLLPKGVSNLLVAGRCISTTHEAQASYRIMPFCAEIGQAAGVAVSVAKKNNTSLQNVDIKDVQKILRLEGIMI